MYKTRNSIIKEATEKYMAALKARMPLKPEELGTIEQKLMEHIHRIMVDHNEYDGVKISYPENLSAKQIADLISALFKVTPASNQMHCEIHCDNSCVDFNGMDLYCLAGPNDPAFCQLVRTFDYMADIEKIRNVVKELNLNAASGIK